MSMTTVTLSGATLQDLNELPAKAPDLKRLVIEQSRPALGLEALELIAAAPYQLTHLVLPGQDLKGAKAGKLLATSPAFEQLEYLELGDNPLTDAFFKPFVTRAWRLKFLGLSYTKLGVDGLTQLAASKHFTALENLNLSADSRRPLGATIARLGDGNFPALRRLNALGLVVGTEGFAGLLGSAGLPRLEELQADGGLDIPALVATLPETLAMPLRRLGWEGTVKGDLPWERLRWLGGLEALRMMHVLKDRGFLSFLARAPIANLLGLELDACDLGAEGAAMLARVPFTRLARLSIWRSQIFADGAVALAEAPWLGGLEGLRIDEEQVGAAGVELLSKRAKLGIVTVLEKSWYQSKIHEWPDAPASEAPPPPLPPVMAAAPVAALVVQHATASEPEPATAKEGAQQVLAALAACSELLGPGKASKDALVFEGQGWKLAVVIKPAQLRVLEPWERAGICLVVEAFVRIPAMERLLAPELSDKEFAKLPFKDDDAMRRPTLRALISPETKHYWRLKDAGGPTRLARRIADQLEVLAPVIATPLALASRAAEQAVEITGKHVNGIPGVSFRPTACLAAALGFLAAGEKERASAAMVAWAARADNASLSAIGTDNGLQPAERIALAQQLQALVTA